MSDIKDTVELIDELLKKIESHQMSSGVCMYELGIIKRKIQGLEAEQSEVDGEEEMDWVDELKADEEIWGSD